MKITTDQAVYVQRNDLAFLENSSLDIFYSVYLKAFGSGTVIDDHNRYEFVRFDGEQERAFFNAIPWMIEYTDIQDISDDKILDLFDELGKKRNQKSEEYKQAYRKNGSADLHCYEEIQFLDFEIRSLQDVFLFRHGELPMTLPEEIQKQKKIKN